MPPFFWLALKVQMQSATFFWLALKVQMQSATFLLAWEWWFMAWSVYFLGPKELTEGATSPPLIVTVEPCRRIVSFGVFFSPSFEWETLVLSSKATVRCRSSRMPESCLATGVSTPQWLLPYSVQLQQSEHNDAVSACWVILVLP